ncbi:hypothetical protein [Rahnella laticis]|uniref:hypothetical protein n=1 Tax=Rahnella laticis TaxID=2787622 RepID=UPI0018A2C175|nr:hypothetical protein [Rahnella laticis]MBF7994836.1 hypothetical protein [Rahnella laticis]
MNKENKFILLTGEEAISTLKEIEYMLLSLRDIARYYYGDSPDSTPPQVRSEYCEETTRFIDENNITCRLAYIREVISSKFNDELGDDDMDDIEREMEKIKIWKKP